MEYIDAAQKTTLYTTIENGQFRNAHVVSDKLATAASLIIYKCEPSRPAKFLCVLVNVPETQTVIQTIGGKVETYDPNWKWTAMREYNEETGIDLPMSLINDLFRSKHTQAIYRAQSKHVYWFVHDQEKFNWDQMDKEKMKPEEREKINKLVWVTEHDLNDSQIGPCVRPDVKEVLQKFLSHD